MIIGVPKEIKTQEKRVAVIPAGVEMLVESGHKVIIEKGAGEGSGLSDNEYAEVGGILVDSGQAVYEEAEMIVKVKEPLPQEYDYLQEEQIVFTYLHLAAVPGLARVLTEKKVAAIAYETVELEDRSLPLLDPMSKVAGRMAVQIGAHYLEQPQGGSGVLLGGVPGVPPSHVVIIGGGVVGTNAARIAHGIGAQVTILDINPGRLRELDDLFHGRVATCFSNKYNLKKVVPQADLLIGAVLIAGGRTPLLVTEDMVTRMKGGSVIVDVSIDQGGVVETMDRMTCLSQPVYLKHGVIHYAVANIPGSVPRTSTFALTNTTLPYVSFLANHGYAKAAGLKKSLARGLNVVRGELVHPEVARAVNLPYTPLEELLGEI